jgi:hypothetical protein
VFSEKIRRYSFVTALLISVCVPASASVTVFTNRNLWLTATSGVTAIGFEGITTLGGSPVQFGAAGDTIGSVTFQGFDFPTSSPDLEVNYPNVNWGSGAFLQGPAGNGIGQHIIASLPAGVFAVGSDIMLYDPNGPSSVADTITVKLSLDSTIYPALTLSGFSSRGFIGFVSDTQIGSITFFPASDPSVHLALDNFSTGGQAAEDPAPEAATMILCGGGLLLIGLFRRHRNSDAKSPRRA